jgi:hypothetical protein
VIGHLIEEEFHMASRAKAIVAILVVLGVAGCDKEKQVARTGTEPARAQNPPSQPKVTLLRTPHGDIRPQAVLDAKGTLHLIYFKGDNAGAGDLFYVRREPDAAD